MKFLTAIVVLALSILLSQSGIAADNSIEAIRKAAEQGDAVAQTNLGWAYEKGDGVPRDMKEAARFYRLATEQGNAHAQNNLGWAYQRGEGVPQDKKEAARLYRLAAEQGHALAQNNLGVLYLKGEGVPQDKNEAARLYRLAAEQGNAHAQFNLGWLYREGEAVPKDDMEALRWYRKAAAQGHKQAQQYLDGLNVARPAILAGVTPTTQKAEQSLPEIRKAAEQGDAADQFKRGLAYERGDGVPKNMKEAARLYRLAAEQGNVNAQNNLGRAYERGEGVLKDMKEALRLYHLAAEEGNTVAQNNLVLAYARGEDVRHEAIRLYRLVAEQGSQYNSVGAPQNLNEAMQLYWLYRLSAKQDTSRRVLRHSFQVRRNTDEAVRLFRLAAEQGNADGQNYLGLAQRTRGFGVSVVPKEAARLFYLAAEQGNAGAQNNLGEMYDEGEGVPQDKKEAERWYVKAAKQGDVIAQRNLKNLRNPPKPSQRNQEGGSGLHTCIGSYSYPLPGCKNAPQLECAPGPGLGVCRYNYY
jgi:TPR repeat protein